MPMAAASFCCDSFRALRRCLICLPIGVSTLIVLRLIRFRYCRVKRLILGTYNGIQAVFILDSRAHSRLGSVYRKNLGPGGDQCAKRSKVF